MKDLNEIREVLKWMVLDRLVVPVLDRMPWLMPKRDRMKLMHRISKRRFARYMRHKMGQFAVEVDPGPPGPKEIVAKTAALRQQDVEAKSDPDVYFMSGYSQMLLWLQILEKHSFNLRTAGAIMEIGCGSARLIRHLRCLYGVRLVGTDVDAGNAEWCQKNIPGIEFHLNDLHPPLTFAENDSFDLVFASSVFTHIPLETQELWIKEMHRVLRPGGYLLADVIGQYHQLQMLSTEDRERLQRSGHLVLDSNAPNASFSTQEIGSWDVFQTRREVLRAFGSVFHVHDFIPSGLDLLVMQKL